jgi:hypothetical protein
MGLVAEDCANILNIHIIFHSIHVSADRWSEELPQNMDLGRADYR